MKSVLLKQFCLVLAMLCVSVTASADDFDFQVGGIFYKKSGTYYDSSSGSYKSVVYVAPQFNNSSSNASAYSGDIVIPESVEYDGVVYTVRGIYSYAFRYCTDVTSVTLPASVTSISSYAFEGCSGLESINLENVTSLSTECFWNCTSLKSVNLSNATSFSSWVFRNCTALESVTLSPSLASISNYTFYGCTSLTSLTLPASVTSIGSYAFYGCSKLESINIPSNVTSISEYAFYQCTSLKGIVLPTGIKAIANFSFYNCSAMESINFPEGLENIGQCALQGCAKISTVSLPQSLIYIGGSAFQGIGVTAYTVANGNTKFIADEGVLYDINKEKIVAYPSAKEGPFVVPSTVTALGDYAFSGATKLTELTIPASVLTIGKYAFDNCSALESLVFEDGEEYLTLSRGSSGGDIYINNRWVYPSLYQLPLKSLYIGRNLKYNDCFLLNCCSNLTNITIGATVTSIPEYAFYSCYNISKVTYNGTLASWCGIDFANSNSTPFYYTEKSPLLYIGGNAVANDVTIPAGVTEIKAHAFQNMTGVNSVTVPTSVNTIGESAFNAPSLEKIVFEDAPASLANANAFASTAFLYVPAAQVSAYKTSWTDLATRIFPTTSLSTEVTTTATDGKPALLNEIGGVGHEDEIISLKVNGTINGYDIMLMRNKMTNLRYLDLSDATIVPEKDNYQYYTGYYTKQDILGDYSFYKVNSLRSVTLPKNITSVGSCAFANCENLTSVKGMPATCTTIGSYAFKESRKLSDITIGDGVTTINSNAFYNCSGLKNITIPASVETINSEAFAYCSNLETVKFEEGLKTIGSYAFRYCYALKDLKLPATLTKIGSYAFNNCSNLKNIHIPSMVESIGDYAFVACGTENVYAYTLTPIPINQNTFDYKKGILNAPQNPDEVFWSYYTNTQWSQFTSVVPFEAKYSTWYTGEDEDIKVGDGETIPNEEDEKANGEMRPGSGLIYSDNAFQWLDKLNLKWKGGKFPSLIDNSSVFIDELTFLLDITPNKWYFFCFPFDIDLSKSKFNGKHIWRYYDGEERAANGNGGWKNIGSTDTVLKAGMGYIFQTNKAGEIELTITSPEFTGSDKDVAIEAHPSENAQDASWNFVGNPNISYYDIADLAKTYKSPITVWNPNNNTYDAVSPEDDEYVFHPFEAFFVQKPNDVSAVTFEAANRQTYNETQKAAKSKRAARAKRHINENRLMVNLTISDGNMTDKTRVVFNDAMTLNYDEQSDAGKFMSDQAVPQIYTLDNKQIKYSINERPNAGRVVNVGVTIPAEGTYTISAQRMDCNMMLEDNLTGAKHDLSLGDYEFTSAAGAYDARFTLVPATGTTGINAAAGENYAVEVYDGAIIVSGLNGKTARVTDAAGATVATLTDNGDISVPAGVYVISVGKSSRKVVVK